ncbi:unnamed protein product [Urochloa decumbens]|uniref:DUF1618 domain-containing protein n=1 Tax=Urochloa decumbens TaxID=240449 RepID=A0ABC8YHS1_9POAL
MLPSASSRRVAAMPEPVASASECSGLPAWVLLDTVARIGRCKNETTAHGTTSAGVPIEVSFELADPPGLSRCVVYCPDDLAADPPRITGADGAFLLVRVFFPERDERWMFTDVFVYHAGPGTTPPAICLVPKPYPVRLLANHVGVLSRGGDAGEHCLVVVPKRRIGDDNRVRYDLQVFSTKTGSWSTKDPRVGPSADVWYSEFDPTRVFSIGGGSLAWVDLRSGILVCKEVDHQDPEMVLIQLPQLLPANKEEFEALPDDCNPPMDSIRDATFREGRFRFIEMESINSNNDYSQQQWTATMFERKVFCSENWEWCCTVDSNLLLPADSCLPCLSPEIYDYSEEKLTLNRVISFLPTLAQYRDNAVYMVSKLNALDKHGWILAVDTENKTLEKAVPFSAEKIDFSGRGYLQSAFSKYLSKGAG